MDQRIGRVLALAGAALVSATPAVGDDLEPADEVQAQLSWHLGFGAGVAPQPGYRLTLGYRAEAGSPVASLLQVEMRPNHTLARLAGVPLLARAPRTDQNEVDAEEAPRESANSWVWWAGAGLAAVAIVAASGGSEEHNGQITREPTRAGVGDIGSVSGEDGSYRVCANEDVEGVPDNCTTTPGG